MLREPVFPLRTISVYTLLIWVSLGICCESLKLGILTNTPPTKRTKEMINEALRSECLCTGLNNKQNSRIELIWQYTNETNGLLLSYEVCRMMTKRLDGLITVVDCRAHTVLANQAMVSELPVVHISVREGYCRDDNFYSRHITPCYRAKIDLLKELIIYAGWQNFAFIFDESIGPRQRQDTIFTLSSIQAELTITILNSTSHTSEVVRKLEHVKRRGIKHAIVWTLMSTSQTVFSVASQLNMDSMHYYWMIFQPGISPPDMTQIFYKSLASNALIISRLSAHLSNKPCITKELSHFLNQAMNWKLVEAILMLSSAYRDPKTDNNTVSQMCYSGKYNQLPEQQNLATTKVFFEGFKDNLSQNNIRYDLHSVTRNPAHQLLPVGYWRNDSGLYVHSQVGLFVNRYRDFRNKLINVTAKPELPFVIRTWNGSTPVYTGLAFDILNELAERLNFRYEVVDPQDRRYGAPNKDGKWNGMVGMVKRQEVMMAIGPFSITALRDTVIDYTKPYMDDSIGILTSRPQRSANLFQMMRPFSTNVWICIAGVVILGGVMLTIINRLTPYGCHHPDDVVITDEHSFSQNLWIIYMSVMEQGAIYFPAANSSRCILGFWWIFTILIIATYTANLAAFLTVADAPPSINTLTQLLQQEDLGILVQDGSNLWSMFKDSKNPIYQEMWTRLHGSPSVDGLDAALPYVRTGKYAYVGDKSTLEYVAAQECFSFVVAEESFNAGTYGLVMPENSPFKEAMDFYIMKMLEAGLMANWRQRWWARSDNCTTKSRTSSAIGLKLDTLGGVFIVYLGYVVIAAILLIVSIVVNTKRSQNKQEDTKNEKDKQNTV